ncbi:MAG: sulfotransferase family protein [Neomegalonema sp.]|nr:sulfotransferase family protein [Neomegalonema sp.]
MPIIVAGEDLHLFVHIPKTGGSSIEDGFREHFKLMLYSGVGVAGLRCHPQHLHYAALKGMFDLSVFKSRSAIVRHPLARMVSEYRWRSSRGKESRSFEAFGWSALRGVMRNRFKFDNHLRPQSEFVGPEITVYRFEDGLQGIADKMAAQISVDCKVTLPWKKKSSGGAVTLSHNLLDALHDFYGADYENFGYEKSALTHELVSASGPWRILTGSFTLNGLRKTAPQPQARKRAGSA